jgi:hypothetical protein
MVTMLVILVIVNWLMVTSAMEAAVLPRDKGYAGAKLATETYLRLSTEEKADLQGLQQTERSTLEEYA